jgi:arginyl-tRNA synthetase
VLFAALFARNNTPKGAAVSRSEGERVITRDVRDAIARALAEVGLDSAADPGLRPGGAPGRYSSSVAFGLAEAGKHDPGQIAAALAAALATRPPIAEAVAGGTGYLTITVTPETLAARVTEADPASAARSDALRGTTVTASAADPLAATTWEEARGRLAAELTARLAAAAGATVTYPATPERAVAAPTGNRASRAGGDRRDRSEEDNGEVAAAVAFAGADTVRFALARAVPGRRVRLDPAKIARHVLDNPAYAVRYAHARAASGVRWAAALGAGEADPPRLAADPADLALLDALSWLPERVATAARRGRPDEFARYLEELASLAVATLTKTSNPGSARAPGTDKLALARAAQVGLAAGLDLLGVSAPDRL